MSPAGAGEGEGALTYTLLSRQTEETEGSTKTRLKIRVESPEKPTDARLEGLARRVVQEEGDGKEKMTIFFYSPSMNYHGGGFAVAEFSNGELNQFNIPCGCTQW